MALSWCKLNIQPPIWQNIRGPLKFSTLKQRISGNLTKCGSMTTKKTKVNDLYSSCVISKLPN